MTTDRDPVVAGVLDLLPVEPPGERFWVDLAARLRAERPSPLLRPVPPLPDAEAMELRRTRPPVPAVATYRRRRVLVGLVAAAVAAGAVLAVGALRDDGEDLDVGPLGPTSTTAQPDPTSTSTPPDTSGGSVGGPAADADAAAARQVALDWIDAVDRGDADGAWALVGSQSRDQIGGRGAFDELMRSALREGWGAWSQPGVVATAAAVEPIEDTRTWAVTLTGTIAQEGTTVHRAIVMLVRAEGADLVVEPFLPGNALDLIELPPAGEEPVPVEPGAVLAVSVDADRLGALVAIDGRPVDQSDLVTDADGAITGVRVGDRPAGPHALTVAMVTRSGALAAAAQPFTVA